MKPIGIAIFLALMMGEASAISRRDISNLSCAQTQALVKSEGAVILRFRSPRNARALLYDRFVSDDRFCGSSEQTTRTSASASDNAYCPLRKCVEIEIFDAH
jgi:hypothetical protein